MNVFKYFPILLLIGTIAIYCTGNYSSEASTIKTSNRPASVTIRTSASGKTKVVALENAERNAFEVLLFSGVPGSAQPLPLIGNAEEFKKDHQNLYEDLLKNKKYKNFIQSMEFEYQPGAKGSKKIDLALRVDLEALKNELRSNNVISI